MTKPVWPSHKNPKKKFHFRFGTGKGRLRGNHESEVTGTKIYLNAETIFDGSVNLTNMDFMESTQDLKFNGKPVIAS